MQMQPRISIKRGNEVVAQVLCAPGISDGDLCSLLEEAAQDLHWSVTRGAEINYHRPVTADEQGEAA